MRDKPTSSTTVDIDYIREESLQIVKDFNTDPEEAWRKAERIMRMSPESRIRQINWVLNWHASGFPVVKFSPKWGAAAISTSVSKEVIETLKAPWKGFMVELPRSEELLYVQGNKGTILPVTFIEVGYFENEQRPWHVSLRTNGPVVVFTDVFPAFNKGDEEFESHQPDYEGKHPYNTAKALDLATRLLHSLLCTLNEHKHVQQQVHNPKPRTKNERTGAPIPYYIITEPVTIDLTEHVRQYQVGHRKGKKLELQFVVKGHRKLQHFGPGNLQTKMIWIEPYKRGPEYAPMAVREHEIKDEK